MHALLADSPAASADYRRQARRIRASFAGDAFLRQQALSQLASRRNAQTGSNGPVQPIVVRASLAQASLAKATVARGVETPARVTVVDIVERGFSNHAAGCLQPFGFTFSERLRLLDAAERLGISRFRANMLLALLEHQAPDRKFAPPEIPSRSFAPPLLLILGIEIAVVAALIALCSI
jgi:hypothetical protein